MTFQSKLTSLLYSLTATLGFSVSKILEIYFMIQYYSQDIQSYTCGKRAIVGVRDCLRKWFESRQSYDSEWLCIKWIKLTYPPLMRLLSWSNAIQGVVSDRHCLKQPFRHPFQLFWLTLDLNLVAKFVWSQQTRKLAKAFVKNNYHPPASLIFLVRVKLSFWKSVSSSLSLSL